MTAVDHNHGPMASGTFDVRPLVVERECPACRSILEVRGVRRPFMPVVCEPIVCPFCGAIDDDVLFPVVEVRGLRRNGIILRARRGIRLAAGWLRFGAVRLSELGRRARGLITRTRDDDGARCAQNQRAAQQRDEADKPARR